MFSRYTERAQKAIQLAAEEARRLGWGSIDTGHLFLGLIREGNGLAAVSLSNLDLDLDRLREETDRLLGRGEAAAATRPERLEFTPRAIQVLTEEAERISKQLGHNYVGTEHILLALLRDREGVPARALISSGSTPEQVEGLIRATVAPGKAPPAAGPELPYTERLLRLVLPLAAEEAQLLGDNHIGTEHLLLAICRYGQGRAAEVLSGKGITLDWLRAELKRMAGS